MARLPDPVLSEINVLENYQYVEEVRKKHYSLLADLLHELTKLIASDVLEVIQVTEE